MRFLYTLVIVCLCFLSVHCNSNYVRTPFGPRHRDCVLEVPSGAHIETRHIEGEEHVHVLHPNGDISLHKACSHQAPVQKRAVPTWDTWSQHWWFGTDYAYFTNPALVDPVVTFTANWNVPPAPIDTRGNSSAPWTNAPTLSFWTGIQSPTLLDVLQPVLEWNGLISGNWDLSSWNCCPAGYVVHSSPVATKSGDTVVGTLDLVTPTDPYTFKIITGISNGASTTLIANMTASKPKYTWAEVKSEGYYVTTCDQMPARPINFQITNFVTSAGRQNVKTIPWSAQSYQCEGATCPTSPLSQWCKGTTTPSADTVSISFQKR